jgi:two-component system OmpR family sensor kinase
MSIRLRLTLLYSVVLALTLLAFGIFLYLRTAQDQLAEVDRSLRTTVDSLQPANFAAAPLPPPGNPQARAPDSGGRIALAARLGDPTILVQLDDGAAQPALKSLGLNEEQLPPPASTARHFENVTVKRVPLRMYVAPYDFSGRVRAGGTQASGPFTVLVARSLVDTNRTLARLRFILIAGSLFCLLAATGAGWLLARNALRPIARLTELAGDIGRQQDFKRRVRHDGPEDEVGRLAGTFNVMLDSLDAAQERLRRALEAQRRFVADASHELRTPLTTIRGNVELLCLEGAGTPDHAEALSDIASESERMSRLVNNLLALARADAGFEIPRTPVQVQDVVVEAVQKARRLAGGARIDQGPGAPGVVLGDHDYLLQLLLILLDNALKSTPETGTVTVSTERRDGSILIGVRDTGPGIAPSEQQRVFDRFYRGDPSRHGEGTGLGLSIGSWIATELGGRIELSSNPGQGSLFTVVLPLAPQRTPPAVPTRAQHAAAQATATAPARS